MEDTNGMRTKDLAGKTAARRINRRHQRGTSLIEIMIVLVILLMGLFLAIRVFPIGFGVLRANGNRTAATQLAQNLMGLVKGEAGSMPNGVLYANYESQTFNSPPPPYVQDPPYVLRQYTDINPDNLGPCREDSYSPCSENPTATETDNSYFADINKFRFIKGEAVKVPMPTPSAYGTGSLYTIKFGPMYMDTQAGNPQSVPNPNVPAQLIYFNSYLKVYGAPLTGRFANSQLGANAAGLIPNDQTYLIDYGGEDSNSASIRPASIMLPPRATAGRTNPTRVFNITLSYDNGSQIVTTDADPITITDGTVAFVQITVGGTPVNNVVPGSEVVTRSFLRVASNAAFDPTDPYQYKLLSANIVTGEAQAMANLGVLSFNPTGAGFAGAGTSSEQPFTAYLDYSVLDWHIIRDDREVPSVVSVQANVEGGGTVNLIPVRTTLRSIKRVGDPESDNTFYAGIYGNTAGPNTDTNPKDFQVYSMDPVPLVNNPNVSFPVGTPLTSSSAYATKGVLTVATKNAYYYMLRDVKAKPGASVRKDSSYETGVIYFNAAFVKPGAKIRMLYKAVGDWGVALEKAYSRYTIAADPNNTNQLSPLPVRQRYDLFAVFNSNNPAGGQIRLPFCDFNKSAVVTLQYTKSSGEVVRLAPIQMTFNQQGADKTANPAFYDQRYAYVNVAEKIPFINQADFNNAVSWQVVGTIKGVSIKTRVIWHDNDTPNERWHVQDMDSYLNQTAVQ